MTQLKKRKLDSTNSSINRKSLDFDFEKTCSVTLSSNNINCCLGCGKFFQGNSTSSPAYKHSISSGHSKFLNLATYKLYTLPENIVSEDNSSIEDVIQYLNPEYTSVEALPEFSYDLNQDKYLVGYVGLNNLNSNSYINVVLQCLAHIIPIRDFYLFLPKHIQYNTIQKKSPINDKFGLLIRKIWSKYLFKSHIAPYEVLNCISEISNKKFTIELEQSPKVFLIWFINTLHSQLGKSLTSKSTPISLNLQGKIEITTIPIISQEVKSRVEFTTIESKSKITHTKFWLLSLDIPHNPLLTSTTQLDKIEEISLEDLLLKYNGTTQTQINSNEVRTYQLLEPLPPYLIISFEKSSTSSTVVKFPQVLSMKKYIKSGKDIQYKLVFTIKKTNNNQWSISMQRERGNDWSGVVISR
ncbi:putative mRNA-splicing protein ubp10 [Spathaspora sp. JA1]|nr:putative mRNA-splicing protein ubp10 [Spathaspora sp. JA1]